MDIIGPGFGHRGDPSCGGVLAKYGDRFLQRIFTDGEIAYCMRHDPVPHLAGRFASWERPMKAPAPVIRAASAGGASKS